MRNNETYVALLAGINVGGHHKVPMGELRDEIKKMGFENIQTLLNSGNVIFEGTMESLPSLEVKIESHLENVFGFSIPVYLKLAEEITDLVNQNPFQGIEVTGDNRLYISFLKSAEKISLKLPWVSEDQSFQILTVDGQIICSVLDLSVTNTPKAMEALGKIFSKSMTTRNWKTINRIANKL